MSEDKLANMYFNEVADITDNEYVEDTKKINQNMKVWDALLEILKQDCSYSDFAHQLESACNSVTNAFEVRAFKIGITMGQAVAKAKA